MKGLAWFLTACLCWCAVSMPCFAAERQIARHQGLTASVDSNFGCAPSASVTIRAPEPSAYTGDRIALQRLLGTVRAGLGADCPILSELNVTGFADGDPAFQATITADEGWRLPTGVGRILAENPLPPLASETAKCDHEWSDPFAGCWITIYPEKTRGTILNIRKDGTWYWDTPEKLALGEPAFDGKEIKHDYMYLAGPYLTFVQKNGFSSSMVGPYFGWECNILKLNPYDPQGIVALMGTSLGIEEPHIFVRLRSPLKINTNILEVPDDNLSDGFTGNPGDDEIVESMPDEGPSFTNCVDNFDQDISDQMMLDIALLAIPAFRLPSLVSPRYINRIFPLTLENPLKYSKLIRAIAVRGARKRQAIMLSENVGYNLSSVQNDLRKTIGQQGTYITDRKAIEDMIGSISASGRRSITTNEANRLEFALGLEKGALGNQFKIRRINNINSRAPRSPVVGGKYFLGPGQHLPGGGPEMVIDSISTKDGQGVETIMEIFVQ